MGCDQINKIRKINSDEGLEDTEAGYWQTTPASGAGLWGAELWGVHGCEFKLARATADVRSGVCGKHQWVWSKAAASQFESTGGYWHDASGGTGAYGWFMGNGNQADHGTGSVCYTTTVAAEGWATTQDPIRPSTAAGAAPVLGVSSLLAEAGEEPRGSL